MQFTRCLLFTVDASQCVGHGRAVVTRPLEGCLAGAERSCEMGGEWPGRKARPLSFPNLAAFPRGLSNLAALPGGGSELPPAGALTKVAWARARRCPVGAPRSIRG